MTLGEKLFNLIEADQGDSYISDSIETFAAEDVIGIARGSLIAHEKAARKLRTFIKQYEDAPRRTGGKDK